MAGPTVLPEVEAERWASELDAFVGARDGGADARLARIVREARVLAREIRDLVDELRDARAGGDDGLVGVLLENLGGLRRRALDLLGAEARGAGR